MYEPWKTELLKLDEKLKEANEKIKTLTEENTMLKKQKIFLQQKCREKKNDE